MHDLQALIANSEPLRRHAQSLRTAVLCELPQGLALLPLTDVVLAELAVGQGDVPSALLPTLTRGALAFAVAASQAAPVAFVSTCYFGGQGTQDALVWSQGELIFSPRSAPYADAWPNSPISRALRTLGIVADDGSDEFDTVGLGKYRTTEKWAASARA